MQQGNYGTPTNSLADLYSERILLTPRTSDPGSPTQGDLWLRTDLDVGSKIATVRFQGSSSTVDIPVFTTGSSESGVEEILRVQTANGEGYIPLVANGGAYNQLAVQHSSTRHGWHDSTSEFGDIIDNFEVELYDEQNNTLSTYYAVDLSQFTRQQTDVLVESYSLQGDANNGNFYGIVSTSGLPDYPAQGETFRMRFKSNSIGSSGSGDTQVVSGWFQQQLSATSDGYEARVDGAGSFDVDVRDGGRTNIDSSSVAVSDATAYEIQITHEPDGNINVKLLDDTVAERGFDGQLGDTVSGVDTTWGSGGIRWFINSGGEAHTTIYDEYRTVESWVDYRTYNSNNPIISPSDNPDADGSQYIPAVTPLPGGGYAMYVKSDELADGDTLLRLWESSDGVSWTRQSATIGPSDTSVSDAEMISTSNLVYNPDDSTYYLWGRVWRANNPDQVRLFTGSSHDSLTEDSTNPILTVGDFGFANPTSISISDVIQHNGTTYCYGRFDDSVYYGTMADYGSTASPQAEIAARASEYESGTYVGLPSIFQRNDGNFVLCFYIGESTSSNNTYDRQTYSAVGSDPTSFNPKNDILVSAKAGTWRERWAYGGDWLKQLGYGNKKLQSSNGLYRFYFNGQPTDTTMDGNIGLVEYSNIADFSP